MVSKAAALVMAMVMAAPCGGPGGGGSWDPTPGDVLGGASRPNHYLKSTMSDVGESQLSKVYGSEGLGRLGRRPWTLDNGYYRGHVDEAMAGSSFG
jgi:hypothetical protein